MTPRKPRAREGETRKVATGAEIQAVIDESVSVAHSHAPAHVINEQRAQFLERFSECGSVLQACNDTGVPRRTHYHWLSEDAEYKAAFEAAKREAVDALEARVFQRANVESDRLAEFLLKGLKPEVYGDRFKAELTGKDGGPIDIRAAKLESLTDDELNVALDLQRKLTGGA